MLQIINGLMLGGYRLTHLIQDGGDGRRVYLAQEVADESRFAVVKLGPLCDPIECSRLNREFVVLRVVACEGVVRSLDYGVAVSQGVDYLILTHHGPSLAVVMGAHAERLTTETALAIGYSAAIALGQLHTLGWCHGDLKPGNLLCDVQGKLLLSDLEFACRLDQTDEQSVEVATAGTPPFMAPELLLERPAAKSKASDVWALGVTLYLALFGEYPFGHGEAGEIRDAIGRGPVPRLDEVAEPLRRLLLSFFAVDPRDRIVDGKQAAAAIAGTITELGLYLAAGVQSLSQLVADLPPESLLYESESSTIRPFDSPRTDRGPQVPLQQKTVLGLPSPPQPAAAQPATAPSPPPPRLRPEGVGAADEVGALPLRRFYDIASVAAPRPVPVKPPSTQVAVMPSPARAPSPAAAPASTAAPQQLKRRAAARWYRRMNPQRNFPLTVVLSGKQIRIVGGSGLGITLGDKEIVLDADDPVLSVEPCFPGCLISPPRADVHCTQDTTICRFWITPLVCDELSEACVKVRYRGQIVESLATPSKVVTRTSAKFFATMGLVSPIAGKALHLAGWDPDELLRKSVPYAADLVGKWGLFQTGLFLTTSFMIAAVGCYYLTRPLLSEEA